MRLSIRWRLTLWNSLALAVVLLGFAALVYGLVHGALYQQIDRTLLTGLQQIQDDYRLAEDPDGRLAHWVYELHEHENMHVVVFGADRRVRLRTQELAEGSVPAAPTTVPNEFRLADRVVPILGRQRVLEGWLGVEGENYTVVLMSSLAELDHELTELLTALLIAVPIALTLSAGVGYLLARKALAPVEQLRRQTRQITADRLDQRLPVANADDELGQLTETINAMIGRLERSFAEVRRFTADASHELRTPLTAVRAEVEAALRHEAVPDAQRHLLGSVLEECQRLTRLTDQLLALSREDAGMATRTNEPVDIAALTCAVADTMRPLAEVKGVCLQIDDTKSVRIKGDGPRLRQVLYNLIDNAIKYTPAGGAVDVRVEERGGAAVVTVRDTGEGIPAEHLARVFDRFYRVDKARSREHGGTGLGLSIARSIVAAHGGTIALDSTFGRGTSCTVVLPVDPVVRP